ncbi:metalloprotease [Vararia minispora EC-137]|uniref:Metalloprotease n=1 Tax=Vararia minispora EC-137 TaxID=1314806 RepID=A0ACB8QVM9_9AGAM|nr:metalloprotease [Vararia minispora EC-137]
MSDREARASTDQETAPLLADAPNDEPHESFKDRFADMLHEPLTPMNKLLLLLVLFFLILSSVFIGLFAGAETRLNNAPSNGPATTVTSVVSKPTTVLATTTVIVAPVPSSPPSSPPPEAVCLTSECVKLSAAILSSLDTTHDPCENFYAYATGGWLKSHPLPSDKGRFGQFAALSRENLAIVQDILSADGSISLASLKSTADERLLTMLRDLYSSCMNEDTLDEFGNLPLKEVARVIRRLYRGDGTDIKSTDTNGSKKMGKGKGFTAALAYLHSKGISALFDMSPEGDAAVDPNWMILWFSQPWSFGLPSKEYFQDADMRELYTDVLTRLLTALNEEEPDAAKWEDLISARRDMTEAQTAQAAFSLDEHDTEEAQKIWPPWPWPPWGGDDGDKKPLDPETLAKKIVEFERNLANATLDLDKLTQDPFGTYNKVPISNVTSQLSKISFPNYFAAFNPRNYPEEVIVTYPPFVTDLGRLLNDTDDEVLEGYFVARAALSLSSRLSMKTEEWKAVRGLQEVLQGIKPGAVGDRAEYCVNQVDSALGFAAGRFFVNETFGGDSRDKGIHIIGSFKESLANIAWMDDKSAAAAAQKADKLRIKVGYPLSPNTTRPGSLLAYYNLVKISKLTFFSNMLSADASDVYKSWQFLGKKRDQEAWEMTPATVNAYYNPPANELVFPAGIMRPPFFSKEWPAYLQYGAFGMVASHELTHAFDSAGRMYNQDGKLEEWWTNQTSEGFKVRQQCIQDQYSSYYVLDPQGNKVYVNGLLTAGENIGDSGIIQAFRAWQSNFNASYAAGNEYLLPGLNYTREQLFFIAFGRQWAENIKPASLVQRVRTDPHSPNEFRVDGTISNVPEFAKAFNCSAKARLNPPDKQRCMLWS